MKWDQVGQVGHGISTALPSAMCATSSASHLHHGIILQGLHRLEKYLNLEGFLEKLLKIKSALKSS